MIRSLATGRATAAVLDGSMRPFDRITDRPPVVGLHGLNGSAAQPLGGQPAQAVVYDALTRRGFTVACPTTGNGWGNTASRTRVAEAVTWARSSLDCSAGPVVRVGTSHGSAVALQSAYANLAGTACVVGILPAVDFQYFRVQDTIEGIAGLRASIDAAAGVVYPAALPANFSPLDIAAGLSTIPILFFYCSDDDISNNVTTFAAAHGNTTLVSLGALGHTEAAVSAVNLSTLGDFVAAHT